MLNISNWIYIGKNVSCKWLLSAESGCFIDFNSTDTDQSLVQSNESPRKEGTQCRRRYLTNHESFYGLEFLEFAWT
jgi:hypothetical protein